MEEQMTGNQTAFLFDIILNLAQLCKDRNWLGHLSFSPTLFKPLFS